MLFTKWSIRQILNSWKPAWIISVTQQCNECVGRFWTWHSFWTSHFKQHNSTIQVYRCVQNWFCHFTQHTSTVQVYRCLQNWFCHLTQHLCTVQVYRTGFVSSHSKAGGVVVAPGCVAEVVVEARVAPEEVGAGAGGVLVLHPGPWLAQTAQGALWLVRIPGVQLGVLPLLESGGQYLARRATDFSQIF